MHSENFMCLYIVYDAIAMSACIVGDALLAIAEARRGSSAHDQDVAPMFDAPGKTQ
jgi:hypothetical protein